MVYRIRGPFRITSRNLPYLNKNYRHLFSGMAVLFLCHRMNEMAPPSILWPVFARNTVFCGHRMNKWALPYILWPRAAPFFILWPGAAHSHSFCGLAARKAQVQKVTAQPAGALSFQELRELSPPRSYPSIFSSSW